MPSSTCYGNGNNSEWRNTAMKLEDANGLHLYEVENGKLELDGTVDMSPYLNAFFKKLQSSDIEGDGSKLLYYLKDTAGERGLEPDDIPAVSNAAVFLMYALICTEMTESQLSDIANDTPGILAALSFDRLFRENGMKGRIRNRYIWHLVLWKIYCLQYNRNPNAVTGELFLCQFFCIAEIIYMSGDPMEARSSFENVVHLGLEISSQADMSDDSFQMLGIAYYYLGLIALNEMKDAAEASKEFSNAVKTNRVAKLQGGWFLRSRATVV